MNEQELDALLKSELLGPEQPPDDVFVARVQNTVLAYELMTARRLAAWKRFWVEAAGSAAVATAFVVMGRLSPGMGELDLLRFAPATAATLILGVWLIIGMRPPEAARLT